MFDTLMISPSDLHLDEENPRFKISMKPTQEDIRHYMLEHENGLRLAEKMKQMDTILPGERVIITIKDNKNIVLEGNRRTLIYQLFLNRDLIPYNYRSTFPTPSKKFLEEINRISVDVVNNRDDALKFLAARHIEGVEKWSSVSKWRLSYTLFKNGKSIIEISDFLALKQSEVQKNIQNYTTLLHAIESPFFSEDEKKQLSPLHLQPDKFIRCLGLSTKTLNLKYDTTNSIISTTYSDDFVDEFLAVLARKAFIDNSINTRSSYKDIENDINKLLKKYGYEKNENEGNNKIPAQKPEPEPRQPDPPQGTGNAKNLPCFFSALQFGHIQGTDEDGIAITRIGTELRKISARKSYVDYPISAAMLTRSMIEHSLIYYSKKHKPQNSQTDYIIKYISNGNSVKQLGGIIDTFQKSLAEYIPNKEIAQYFKTLFITNTNNSIVDRLNWVVHRPDKFSLSPQDLESFVSSGVLSIINYLIE